MHSELAEHRLYTRALSRPTFASLAKGAHPSSLFRFLADTAAARSAETVGELLARSYDCLCKYYRNEYIYKSAVANKVVFGRHSPRTCSLSVELPIGKSIVDLAVFNGTSTAYEIKTEMDTPRRLVTQTLDYLRTFDRVYIVTHPRYAIRYVKYCDNRVGILVLNKAGSLTTIRPAEENNGNLDLATIFRTLRRSEYVPALEAHFGQKICAPNGLIAKVCEEMFCKLPLKIGNQLFLNAMRSRGLVTANTFVADLPPHLRVLGYATPLTNKQQHHVLETLKAKLVL